MRILEAVLETLHAESARVGEDAGHRLMTDDEVVKVMRVSGPVLEAVIRSSVERLPERSPRPIGVVRAALKDRFAGAYEGRRARALARAALG